jgi:hypothetical protein
MARAQALLAIAITCALAPAAARGAQRVALTVQFSPDRLGASTTIIYGFQISASHGGFPSAVTDINLHLPAGMGLATSTLGLATCERSVLVAEGPNGCPANSHVGFGSAEVQVPFASYIINETANITVLFGPPENEHLVVLFYVHGRSPIAAELVFPGLILPDSGLFGARLDTAVPVIPAVPLGPNVAVVRFRSTIGPRHLTYYRSIHGKRTSFQPKGLSVPTRCPRGGFPFTGDFTFADGSHTRARSRVPCPAKASSPRRRTR